MCCEADIVVSDTTMQWLFQYLFLYHYVTHCKIFILIQRCYYGKINVKNITINFLINHACELNKQFKEQCDAIGYKLSASPYYHQVTMVQSTCI